MIRTKLEKVKMAMLAYQTPDGRFYDILKDPATFIDGTSAMMVASYIYRALNNKKLPESYKCYADKISETMEQYIDSFGIIHGVCGCPHFVAEGTSAESMAAYVMMNSWKNA